MSAGVPWSDTMTELRSQPGMLLAKQFGTDGTCRDFDNPKHFSASVKRLDGLLDLSDELRRLLSQPDVCIVRGEPLPGANWAYMRRLALPDKKTGDAATLADVPHRWLLLDADGIPRPENVPAHDLLACADLALELLPPPFQRAACVVVASANHGIKMGCRLRLGFWCDRPMTGRELNRWLRGAPLDTSVFRPAQIIYSAAPIFAGGRRDHLPTRIIEYPGEDWLQCPPAEELADPAPAPATPPHKVARGKRASSYGDAALASAADAVIGAGEGGRHRALVKESRGLGRLVAAKIITERDVLEVLGEVALRAGKTDVDEVASCIAWGLENPSSGKLPEAKRAA